MNLDAIVERVREVFPFLSECRSQPRHLWNAQTTGFNAHLVNESRFDGPRDGIQTFWSASPLTDVARLALASMVAQRHPVTLYTYDALDAVRAAVPSGVLVVDAVTVLPRELFDRCLAKAEIRYFSDIFRYAVLYQEGGWWLDVDVVLLKPLQFPEGHIFSSQWGGSELGHVCVGDVMRAPIGSPHMRALYELAVEHLLHSDDAGFGAIGPVLLTQYLLEPERSELVGRILPPTHFNAIDWTEVETFVAPDRSGFGILSDPRVTGVHLWSKAWSDRGISFDDADSASVATYLRKLYDSHNYLDDLAIRNDSDKATRYRDRFGHGYVRIYQQLLRTQVLRPLRVLEIGLCRGLVEGWVQDQVPSLLTWLEFLPNAYVVGADIQDFSWFAHPRATTSRLDQSSRDALTQFAAAQPEAFDIIIDDASHASPHQQLTLGILYPLLKPGGYYIVEDLDWQPEEFEDSGTRKTKDCLFDLKRTGTFSSRALSAEEESYIADHTASVMFHDSHSELLFRGLRGGLGVLRKAEDAVAPARAWQRMIRSLNALRSPQRRA